MAEKDIEDIFDGSEISEELEHLQEEEEELEAQEMPETTIQRTAGSHIITIPVEIVKKLNLSKGDKLRWSVPDEESDEIKALVEYEGGIRIPLEERE